MYSYALHKTPRVYGTDLELESNYRADLSFDQQVLFDLELLEVKRFFIDIPASRLVYVSVYNRELCYGGAEEGGWWYDAYSLEKSMRVLNQRDLVVTAMSKLRESYPESKNYYSVNGGHSYDIFAEYRQGKHNTLERPRYS